MPFFSLQIFVSLLVSICQPVARLLRRSRHHVDSHVGLQVSTSQSAMLLLLLLLTDCTNLQVRFTCRHSRTAQECSLLQQIALSLNHFACFRNRKNFNRIRGLVLQAAILRPILMFVAAVLWTNGSYSPGEVSADTSHVSGFITLTMHTDHLPFGILYFVSFSWIPKRRTRTFRSSTRLQHYSPCMDASSF